MILDSHIDRLRSASGLKSASTDIIISNHGPIYLGYSQISVLSKLSVLWPIYWLGLGHMSVTSLDVDLRKWETAIDLRIGRRLWNLKKDRFGKLKKGHTCRSEVHTDVCDVEIDMDLRIQLDIDLSLTYLIYSLSNNSMFVCKYVCVLEKFICLCLIYLICHYL